MVLDLHLQSFLLPLVLLAKVKVPCCNSLQMGCLGLQEECFPFFSVFVHPLQPVRDPQLQEALYPCTAGLQIVLLMVFPLKWW